nr:DUF3883 domain-containing protein [Tessaracoccus sp. MC1756]
MRLGVEELQRQLLREHAQAPGLFREMANIESLLAETYRARVLYELLQNSDDAGARQVEADLSKPNELVWRNDGRAFTHEDFEALCRSANSAKQRGGDTIGYRGIGFKAVASVADRVTVGSSGVRILFDRNESAQLLGTSPEETPLLRVPARVIAGAEGSGAEFTLSLGHYADDQLNLDPIALLFLRNVTKAVLRYPDREITIQSEHRGDSVLLTVDGSIAEFQRKSSADSVLLIPMDSRAEALAGHRGRLACFLPLDDELGFAAIASGNLLTDPSRTHAVLRDPSTEAVVESVGQLFADFLLDTEGAAFKHIWDLLLGGEDLRTIALGGDSTVPGRLLAATKAALAGRTWPFSFSEVAMEEEDVKTVFPEGAPPALYDETKVSQARALRTVFSGPTLRTSELITRPEATKLSDKTRTRLATRLVESARTQGRQLSQREQEVVGKQPPARILKPTYQASTPARELANRSATFGGTMTRWRVAEVAAMEYLNGQGWSLTDVSRQNAGYDLEGTGPDGDPVHIEVKKVESRNSRFSLTNNELSVMVAASQRYLLALVIGDGVDAQLALLDPLKDQVPRERVCRRWEWEYTDWARFATLA